MVVSPVLGGVSVIISSPNSLWIRYFVYHLDLQMIQLTEIALFFYFQSEEKKT